MRGICLVLRIRDVQIDPTPQPFDRGTLGQVLQLRFKQARVAHDDPLVAVHIQQQREKRGQPIEDVKPVVPLQLNGVAFLHHARPQQGHAVVHLGSGQLC